MKTRYLRLIQSIALSLLLLASGPLLSAIKNTDVQGIRLSNQIESSRVVFDVSQELKYRVFKLNNPSRVVVDLFNTTLDVQLPAVTDQKLVKSVRSGVHEGSNLRVVFDMQHDVSTKAFLLKPNGASGHRFVVDLKRSNKAVTKSKEEPKPSAKKLRDVIIAVDAGHGGKDPGAIGYAGSKEKDVTLQIAKVIAKTINQQKGMKAVLIRQDDRYISLRQRLAKAREYKADLFMSIHADAFHDHSARGSSIYALSLNGATSEAAAWLAKTSNSNAELMGGVSLDDKDDVVASVLLNLSQTATIQSSLEVGDFILEGMGKFNRLHKGRVQQAGFVVLKSPDIPSVLIETAFLSNPKEEKKLRNKTHQLKIAKAITNGVKKYFIRKAPPGTYLAEQNKTKDLQSGLSSR